MKIALIIGHSHKAQGAVNPDSGLTEFRFNEKLAENVRAKLAYMGQDAVLVYRESYKDLPEKVNALSPDLIVSFHCNAFNTEATGTETLFFTGSENGSILAKEIQKRIVNLLELPDRGIKPKQPGDRGAYLLQKTKAPAVILEPFFIDNLQDLKRALINEYPLAVNVAMGILNAAEKIGVL
jgi:N-acetylmuramoyl-L-alanine amidase